LGPQTEQGGLSMLLVVLDTTQIQPYIFGSNRLRENVGASYLVDAATGAWAFEAVREAVNGAAPGETNIGPGDELLDAKRIEQGLAAEVLYAGGGNFVVLFGGNDDQARERAKEFQRALSMRALLEAPGLQLVIAQQAMQWGSDSLSSKLNAAFRVLVMQKRNRAWSAPLLGLSVTASCNSTGLPATGLVRGIGGEPPYLSSDEIRAKVDVALQHGNELSAADERLQKALPLKKEGKEQYLYPRDFDEMGATAGEYSYIAVVHADGNSMGQRILHIGDVYESPDKNREFVRELRKFSLDVEKAAKAALNVVLDRLVQRIDEDGGKVIVYKPNQKMSIQIELASKDGKYYVPFRPIVFGGDDVTFVCDGRLGLSLAIEYLREFEHQTRLADSLRKDGSGLTACAGVAVVKSHYPFARAYALAEELARSAKVYRRDNEIDGSCLDWHFALSGLSGSIEEVRSREYQASAGSLTLRPVTLAANPKKAQHAWPVIEKGIKAFQGEDWAGHHNKIKALRDVLREGPAAVGRFVAALEADLPAVLPEMSDWPKMGWHGDSCGYFDAIELADWFIPLKGEADAASATASQP
jgi:hypothetical protein